MVVINLSVNHDTSVIYIVHIVVLIQHHFQHLTYKDFLQMPQPDRRASTAHEIPPPTVVSLRTT